MELPLIDGSEVDVFTAWRRLLAYTQRAGVCKAVKRQYRRRCRRHDSVAIADSMTGLIENDCDR